MAETTESWDKVAHDYQRTYNLGINEYNAELLCFLEHSRMIFPGCKVIDIGCGVGKYGTYLAALGCDVTLTDISERMLKFAEENMAQFGTPWRTFCCDFSSVTGDEPVFRDGFDFSMSTMSPAICDVDSVKKMSAMTHGWCFVARFSSWSQPQRDALLRELGVEPSAPFANLSGDCASIIEAVSAAGYVPMVKYVDYNWLDQRTPEQTADFILNRCFDADSAKPEYAAVLDAAKRLCGEDGLFEDEVLTKAAWIYWRTAN